jgi:CHAD domain-containing protein
LARRNRGTSGLRSGEHTTWAMGRPATRLAEAMAGLQEVLGEYQDSLTTRPLVAGLAAAAHEAGEDTFTFGVLYGLERWRGERALARYPRARKAAQRGAVRRWLG